MRSAVIFGVLVGVIVWPWSDVEAQFLRNRFGPEIPREPPRITSEIDRFVQLAMDEAQQLIKQQKYVPAVIRLQSVLDFPEDFFLYKEFRQGSVVNAGVKAQTHQILADLPSEGRAAYELHFGITARTLLNEALRDNKFDQIAGVVQRYQTTAAGFDAMQILAASAFDHDLPVEAALLCETMTTHPQVDRESRSLLLLRTAFAWYLARDRKRTLDTLGALKKVETPENWQVAGRKIPPLPDRRDMVEWLVTNFGDVKKSHVQTVNDWAMPLGGATGNESATKAFPIGGDVWSISPLEHLRVLVDDEANTKVRNLFDGLIHHIEVAMHDHNRTTQLAAVPIIVGDVVAFRTLNDVTAVSLQTGQLLWRSSLTDRSLSSLAHKLPADFEVNTTTSPTEIVALVQSKLFRDQLSGTLTSDGKYVYAVEEIESPNFSSRTRVRPRQREPYFAPPTNKIVAYELETGRLVWEVGGVRGTRPVELSGSFFLGPPLPFAGRLYCLAEMKDELRLVSMTSENDSPRVEWLQSLIAIYLPSMFASPRRLVGVTPTIADGIMICQTSTNSVVAFDLVRRQLRWGYSYEVQRNLPYHDGNFVPVLPSVDDAESRWLDKGPILANGRVVLTPADSAELHCLNLVDGSLIWKLPRRQGSYVACVNDDAVIVVGRTQIVAYSLTNGAEVWEQPLDIPEPSGRGVRVDSKYLLPLSNGEIATIDLVKGRILGGSRLPNGRIPGNLAVREGTVVSYGIHDVIGFRPMADIERQIARLSTNPKDAEALALRGELRLHEGEQEAGINDLRESLRQKPLPRVKRVLAATLMADMAKDPVRFLRAASELETLIEEPRQRIEFLRSYVRLLTEAGDRVGAVKQLLRLAETPQVKDETIYETPGFSITLWQNIRSQLLTLHAGANAEQRLEIDQVFERELEKTLTSKNRERRLNRFVNLMSNLPLADSLLQRLLESKDSHVDDAFRARILEQLTQSTDKSIVGYAVASLALLAVNVNSPRDAFPWISKLKSDFLSQICLDGKTGRQIADELLAQDDVRRSRVTIAKWPARLIHVESSRERRELSAFPVAAVTHAGPYFENWTFEIDANEGLFKARDPSLRVVWQLQHASFKDVSREPVTQLHVRGRRLALSCGANLIVMESGESTIGPRILFEEMLHPNGLVDRRQPEPPLKRPLLPNGRRFESRGSEGFLIGLSDEAVFYRTDNRLFAADVETGDVLWTRMGPDFVKSDATVDTLLTLHTTNNDALILRPLDGTVLQQHKGNRDEIPLWFRGTRRLSDNREKKDQQVFEMRDFDGDKVIWQVQHPAGTLPVIVNHEDFAVLEPSGKLYVYSLETGKLIVTSQIPLKRLPGKSGEFAVQRFGDRYIVFAGISSDRSSFHPMARNYGLSSDTTMTVDGYVCAVDRGDANVAWTVTVEQVAYDFAQPTNMPVLVLASRQNEMAAYGQPQRLNFLILDKRTGLEAYKTQEPISLNSGPFSQISRGVQLIPMIDEEKLIVDFQELILELTFPRDAK